MMAVAFVLGATHIYDAEYHSQIIHENSHR